MTERSKMQDAIDELRTYVLNDLHIPEIAKCLNDLLEKIIALFEKFFKKERLK